MAKTVRNSSDSSAKKMRPALTPEAQENQMISLSMDVARRQLLEGTASSQVIVHFLKLGSTKEKLEKERLVEENELLRAKVKALESASDMKEMYAEAIKAMRTYSGTATDEDEDDDIY